MIEQQTNRFLSLHNKLNGVYGAVHFSLPTRCTVVQQCVIWAKILAHEFIIVGHAHDAVSSITLF